MVYRSVLVLITAFSSLVTGDISDNYGGRSDEADIQYDIIQEQYSNPNIADHERRYIDDVKLQRFMDALIMEAGRHYLYPPKDLKGMRFSNDFDSSSYIQNEGEPEYIDLIRKRKIERDLGCPDRCFDYRPVCGSDGKAYDSECHLQKANCGLQNITVTDWENCRGKHFLCPTQCLDISDPVCGNDGRMYHNICVMRKRNCGKTLETRPVKFCYPRGREPKMFDSCPEDCQEIYKPVCGSDGVLYYNACFMKMRTCGSDIELLDLDSCTETQRCPERCIPIYDPVCGSDGKLYMNLCKMLLENCGSNVKKMPESFCGGIKRG